MLYYECSQRVRLLITNPASCKRHSRVTGADNRLAGAGCSEQLLGVSCSVKAEETALAL